ncbi:MAG TPA: hypothetical protein VFL86_00810 [Burkholderiaceae bacterium]|nr:hypothetical protein [Burkholderiaceae bacterium]
MINQLPEWDRRSAMHLPQTMKQSGVEVQIDARMILVLPSPLPHLWFGRDSLRRSTAFAYDKNA